MNKYLILLACLFFAGCASATKDLQRTQFKLGHTYMFTSHDGEDYLTVKLLEDTDPKKRRLLAQNMDTPDISPFQAGDNSIMRIESFYIDQSGRISFRYYTHEICEEVAKDHPFFVSASNETGNRCSDMF